MILAKPYCKFTQKVNDPLLAPFFIEKAIRLSMTGRPGPVYLDFPGDVLRCNIDEDNVVWPDKMSPLTYPIAPAD